MDNLHCSFYTELWSCNFTLLVPQEQDRTGGGGWVRSQGETIMAMSELSCRMALLALGGLFLSSFPQIRFESSPLTLWGQSVQTQGNWECGILGSKSKNRIHDLLVLTY